MKLKIQLFGGRGASSSATSGKSGSSSVYKYKDSYQSYNEKQMRLSGSDFSDSDNPVFGTRMWSGTEYTNDEFVEHLIDSNFHTGARAIMDNKLTNEEVSYIKDNTTFGQWGLGTYKGKNWWNKDNIEEIIKDARKSVRKK